MNGWREIGIRVIGLTGKLVGIRSVVDTDGEGEIAAVLEQYLREHSPGLDHVEIKSVQVDKPTSCAAVLAHARPAVETKRALLLCAHIDTVGFEPYGSLAAIGTDSRALREYYAASDDPAVASAAADPDWAFGRGWLDMKGGIAAGIEVFLHEAKRRELPAHLLLLLMPDEESASRGARALIPELIRLKHDAGLEYTRVLNLDYVAPLKAGEEARYFYSGVIGKMLVGLSVFGRTTHASETFGGVNASALAGYLAYGLEHDRKLLAGVGGEWLPPPTVLHMGDRRVRYDVMTSDSAEVYVNLFHLAPEPTSWWQQLIGEVRRLVRRFDRDMRRRYQRYVAKADQELPRYSRIPEVIDYATLLNRAARHTESLEALLTGLKAQASARYADERQRALSVIRGVHRQLPPGRPLVVVSLLPPFYPAQLSSRQDSGTRRLIELGAREGLKHRRVYPYISDMSYFSFDDQAHTEDWGRQSPLWFDDAELARYREVATPVCNIGPWGVGAHTAEERVYLPFLRDELPRVISEALHALAAADDAQD